jgi:glycosyltransferase involved in cell wall biosynthesis
MKPRLAIVTSHPIQYNAPWFRLLSERNKISIKVFYTLGTFEKEALKDPGFGRTIKWDIPLLEGYEFENVKNISVAPGTRNYSGIVNPELVSTIEKWRPSALLVFGWNFNSHLKCIRHFSKKMPVFFRGDSTLLNEGKGIRKYIRRTVLKWVYRNVDIAFYVGQRNKDYFLRNGLQKSQLVLAAHAIDNDRFMQPEAMYNDQAKEWLQSLGIPNDHFVVLYAGKFEAVKNVSLLLKAARLLNNVHINFILAGNGPLEADLKAMAGSNVHFLDFQNQQKMPVLYRLADVYVLPSLSETWGLGVNEAMACSRAVLVSDQCGCAADLVNENCNGYIFKSENAEDLVEKLTLLYNEKGRIRDMGRQSLNIIRNFSFEKIAVSIEQVMLKEGDKL